MKVQRALAVSLSALLAASCGEREPRRPFGMSMPDVLGGAADAGFARAVEPPLLRFPADHGPHPSFRTEWWYVTGNVDAANGRRFGVQLVFFRHALAAAVPQRRASLAARDVVFAHAAVTDVAGARFHFAERLSRAADGLAFARLEDGLFRAACAEWRMSALPGGGTEGGGLVPMDLRAGDRDFSFELRLSPGKPLVLQGDRGLSQKSAERGNASIYYSMTRLPLAGVIEVGGERFDVRGLGWLDREWSTSALGPDQVGWDWFSLQLENGPSGGEELMWYQLRHADGGVDRWSRGCLVARDGTVTPLTADEVTAQASGTFVASDGLARYPARWRLRGPGFDLEIEPLLNDQELRVLVRYWEGAVAVRGTRSGAPVQGRGYLEMTGYAASR
jgi:predicted secreted hydrolase